MPLSFTWLGHGTFLLRSPAGNRVLLDPWVTTNPACPDDAKKLGELDLILVTHGHFDHANDAVSIARSSGGTVVACFELATWLEQKGLQHVTGMNLGGTLRMFDMRVTMVPAQHSSSLVDEGRTIYMGLAAGYVIRFDEGPTIYFAGDTALFGDMRIIADVYQPSIAFLPIGDLYTMGPEEAARACEMLKVKQVVPMHYGTFPALTGTPAALRRLVEPRGIQVLELKPGETAS